ncbi:MAG: HNH endonuclease [Candidatus Latescibacteria bacterium]|nr:HNH endonuclease [Candidatus Latescibacterota bacterium]
MNYLLGNNYSVILMSLRANAPYTDKIEEDGKILIYEGHDIPNRINGPIPKSVDQPMINPGGTLTQNGLFYQAAKRFKVGNSKPACVKVYEKIRPGIWAYNGLFNLIDAWNEESNDRKVFKFRLELVDYKNIEKETLTKELEHERIIPSAIKLQVWKRDKGKCVKCGSTNNLHFDHIIPYSKGGSSLVVENIQLLCARHNLNKSDKIE